MKKHSLFCRTVIGSVCLIAFGIILLLNPDLGSAAAAGLIGWMLIAAGALWLLAGILSGAVSLLPCVAAFAAGIYLLRHPLSLASLLGLCLGIYLAAQGVMALAEALSLRRGGWEFRPGLIYSVVLLALGIVLIFSPLTTSRLLMCLCGLGMIACGAANLILRKDPPKPPIIDAEP